MTSEQNLVPWREMPENFLKQTFACAGKLGNDTVTVLVL
jgi:hypothetical protein